MTKVDSDRIDLFRREVDWNIACGALAEVDLPVTSNDGGCPVVVAFDDERFSVLLGRLRAVGGFANVFVKDAKGAVRAASVMAELCAVAVPGDRLVGEDVPGAGATVGMFLDYVERHPNGVTVSAAVGPSACARDARRVDLAAAGS